MRPALHTQAALMLQAPWQWSRNDGHLWAFWGCAGLAALAVSVPAAALMFWVARGWVAVLMSLVGAVGLVVVWAVQFEALLRLDHPHSARFVVGHGRALRAAALGLWLALVAFVGAVGTLALHQPGGGPMQGLLLLVMAAGATLLYVAMALRWWVLWLLIWLPFSFFGDTRVRATMQPLWAFVRDQWQAQPLQWTGLALLVMGTALVNLFGRADAAHARVHARREKFRKIASAGAAGQKPALAAYGRWGELLGSPLQRMADAWLARVILRASPQRASVMARACVALYGVQHWVRHVGGIVLAQLVMAVVFYVLMVWLIPDLRDPLWGGRVGLSIGLASMVIGPVIGLSGALWGSRREQALLVLLPGMPQGAALNRALALQQMKHFVIVCAAALPALAAMAWWVKSLLALTYLASALPLAALLCRDVSRLRAPGPQVAWLYVLFVGLCLVNLLLNRFQPALLLPWALGMVLLTAALLVWRWRRLSQWPRALPAGRLA